MLDCSFVRRRGIPEGIRRLSMVSSRTLIAARKAISSSVMWRGLPVPTLILA
jgi:hypothetical protein